MPLILNPWARHKKIEDPAPRPTLCEDITERTNEYSVDGPRVSPSRRSRPPCCTLQPIAEFPPDSMRSGPRTKCTVIKPIGARAVGKVVNDDRADWREAWALFPGSVAYIWHAGTKAGIVQEVAAAPIRRNGTEEGRGAQAARAGLREGQHGMAAPARSAVRA